MSDHATVIDISHWQGTPDFIAAKGAGVLGVIFKATEGRDYVDPTLRGNFSNARAAGLAGCTYHWLKLGNARDQMKHYLATIEPERGERVIIDYEEDGCSLDDLHEAVRALIDYGHNLQITVYSGHLLKEHLGDRYDELLAVNTDLWLAQYTTGTPTWSKRTYPKWSLWQYSESGHVGGITASEVDLDRFNGSDEALLKWFGPAGAAPEPAPEPEPKPESVVKR
jgi:lysozyme